MVDPAASLIGVRRTKTEDEESMSKPKSSPYLSHPKRLADVIAAIQFLGIYKFHKLEIEKWGKRIGSDPVSAPNWQEVFREHPEFFRMVREDDPPIPEAVGSSERKVSLVWRRAYQKRFDVDAEELITRAEYRSRDKQARSRVSRAPLEDAQIATLVRTALDLHDRQIAQRRESRWWMPMVTGMGGILLGALLT